MRQQGTCRRLPRVGGVIMADEPKRTGPFVDTDPESRWIEETKNNCPHCGGSGHKDDCRTDIADELAKALAPFAKCANELDGDKDVPRAPDGEWAKFRLLTDDYRRARAALAKYRT